MKRKNMMYSFLAVVLVVLLVPAALGMVHSMNDAYVVGYVDVYEATPPEHVASGTWAPVTHAVVLKYTNVSGDSVYADLSSSTFTVSNETYTETTIFSAPDDYSSTSVLYVQYNKSVDYLYNSSVDRLHVEFTSGAGNGNVIISVYAFDAAVSDSFVLHDVLMSEKVTLVNGSVTVDIPISVAEFLTCLSAETAYTTPKMYISVSYDNYTLSDGDEIDFAFTFQKQRGVSESALTPYIVGGLGVVLLISAAASTDIIDPTSPYHQFNNPFKKHTTRRRRSAKRRKTTRKRRR